MSEKQYFVSVDDLPELGFADCDFEVALARFMQEVVDGEGYSARLEFRAS